MLIYPDEMALIKAHPYFHHITEDRDVKWFLQCMDAKLETIEAGTKLLKEGEKTEFVPIILSGSSDKPCEGFGTWGQIESNSGLSHSIIALVPPADYSTAEESTVLWMRVMRLLKACNLHCDFHEEFIKKL
ncbi:MAG: hypothetical protein MJ186_00335 [Clostridia bacterium]|nr:hypothetical protein [Clostridia bacterium]